MNSKNYYGHRVARGFRSCTVYVFKRPDGVFIGTLKRTPNPGLTKEEKRNEIVSFLKPFGLKPHPLQK